MDSSPSKVVAACAKDFGTVDDEDRALVAFAAETAVVVPGENCVA